jgi:WD40 repeat protein
MAIWRAAFGVAILTIGFVTIAGGAPPDGEAVPTEPLLMLNAGGHSSTVTRVYFTPDEKQLVSVSLDKTVRIWDVTPNETTPFPGPGRSTSRVLRPPQRQTFRNTRFADGIGSMSMSGNGDLIAIARTASGGSHTIDLISLKNGTLVASLENDFGAISNIAFSPNGQFLSVCGGSETEKTSHVTIWDVAGRRILKKLAESNGPATEVTWDPQSKLIAAACGDGKVRIWNLSGQIQQTIGPPRGTSDAFRWRSVSWSQDGKQLAMMGHEKEIVLSIRNPADGKQIVETGISGVNFQTYSVVFAPNSSQVLIRFPIGAKLLDARTLNLPPGSLGISPSRFPYEHASFSRSGRYIALANGDLNQITVYQAETGNLVQVMTSKGIAMNRVGWSASKNGIAFNYHFDPETDLPLPSLTEETLAKARPARYSAGFDLDELSLAAEGTYGSSMNWQPNGKPTMSIFKHELGMMMAMRLNNGYMLGWFNDESRAAFDKLPNDIQGRWLTPKIIDGLQDVTARQDGEFLATTSAEQTICIWKTGSLTPLLSLFFSFGNDGQPDGEWIAWTENGYYASSAGGESLMGWHVNNGPDKMASFFPAQRFRASLYRPDVIKRLIEAGSEEKALELADAARGKTSRPFQISKVLPPKVEILTPVPTTSLSTKTPITIEAKAVSVGEHPVKSMRLLVDGRPYEGNLGLITIATPQLGEVRKSWSVQLAPGRHSISVQAESEVSKSVSDPIELTLAAERGLTKEPVTADENNDDLPNLYVLAIGISDYPDSLKLNFAHRDAEVLAQTVQSHGKGVFRRVEVKLLMNQQATRKEILQGLTWLRKQMTQRDVAMMMYAGHGSTDSDGNFYLLPVDVDTDDLLSTGVPGDQVKKTLASIPGKVVVLLDACHAGAVDGPQRRSGGSLTDDLVRDLVTDDYGVIVMCSAMGREYALEGRDVQHGFFTLAIVEGLSGKADQNKDGVVYFHELDYYTTDRVKDLAKGMQHPVTTKPTTIRSFPISRPR